MKEADLFAWLKAHGYVEAALSPWCGGWIHFMTDLNLERADSVRVVVDRSGAAGLTWNGEDRTWLPEMDTIVQSGALTRLEAMHRYSAQIEALRQRQAAA